MLFLFGNENVTRIEAKSLAHAIKVFKASKLYPESYVDGKYVKGSKYNNDLKRTKYEFKVDPQIPIKDDNNKLLGKVSLYECLDVDFKKLLPTGSNLLDPPRQQEKESTGTNLVGIGDPKALQSHNKLALREMNDALLLKKAEAERMILEIQESMGLIKKELDQKKKLLYILETYLGINEEVYQIKEGKPAPEDESLTLYQQTLFMDEEVGIWEGGGLDFESLEQFDEFIVKHTDKFLYAPKAVCVFRVRRKAKDYTDDPWLNALANQKNWESYFLIRNGENLYRIWSDVTVGDKLFPTATEYEKAVRETAKHSWAERDLQEKHEKYFYGIIAIQGIMERTDILGHSLRNTVNLLKNTGLDRINFIRDAERENWIGDGKLSWNKFIAKNRKAVTQGTRVLVTEKIYPTSKDDASRFDNARTLYGPSQEEIYEVAVHKKDTYRGYEYKILYHTNEEIYRPGRGFIQRKNRVACWLYNDEVLNFDDITVEDCDYYAKNRLERKDYLYILPTLHYVKKMKLEEAALELEFIKLIAGKVGYGEDRYGDIQKAVTWWKLKNKWKRGLMKDDAKAVRMIEKKLLAG